MTLNSCPPFDLTFLATGAWQHVFVKTGEEEDLWVYKIPAAFGYILPFDHPRRAFGPQERYARTLRFILIDLPRGLNKRIHQKLNAYIQPRGLKKFAPVLKLSTYFSELSCALGERSIAPYLRRSRLKNFETMLELMERLSRQGLADLLSPYQIVRHGEATLRVNDAAVQYQGPLLIQRKGEFIFEESGDLHSFAWQELIEAQHRLWKHGVAFSGERTTVGASGWTLLDGHLRLADTSSLTSDLRLSRHVLSGENLDRLEHGVLRRLKENDSSDSAEEYFRLLRREVNLDKLNQLWRAELKTPR